MKLAEAINELIRRIDDLLDEEEYSDYMLERVYRMKEHVVDPAVRLLRRQPDKEKAAEILLAFHRAIEEYVIWFIQEPEKREQRRKRVEGLKALVRREILAENDAQAELEALLDDIRKWQWQTSLDEKGRLVYSTGRGTVVPARGVIAEKVGPEVIEQAVKAQRPYSDKVRPRDVRGEPGGLIVIEEGRRAIIVGDLHGRYDNLEHILRDKNNLADILSGDAHLIFTGDAIHPRSSAVNSPEAYEDSFCVMLLIMTLKAENPFNVHYLIGNHDNAHVGGRPAGRGQVRQDKLFRKYVTEKFGERVFEHYCRFVADSPAAAKVVTPGGSILLIHACLTPRILSEQGLVNIFVKGRRGRELTELLWSRNYDLETLRECLSRTEARFILSGHTSPSAERARRYGLELMAEGVFAHAHGLQVIMSSQGNTFGYVDLDMTRALPNKVTDLTAPDGKPAFRVLRPRRPVATSVRNRRS